MPNFTRRDAIALGTLGTLATACSTGDRANRKHVAVIGAGIVGASIAYHLAKEGAQVTVLDRYDVVTRASRGTFAWLNATWAKQPQDYHGLNQLGMAGWGELEEDLGLPIKWGGSLEWFADSDRQNLLAEQITEQVEWGEPARMVGLEELRELEPDVEFGGASTAALSPNDGALDPVLVTRRLLDAAAANGAQVRTNCEVRGATERDGKTVLETSLGDIETDKYVLATGADPDATMALAGIDVPQRSTPGVIVVTKPMPPILNRIVAAPGVHVHQRLDGRLVLGEQEGAPQTHEQRLAGRPNRFPNEQLAGEHAERILTIARQYLPAIADAAVEEVYIGWRPLPLDGHPAIGFSPANTNSYIAIAHSGVTLAPILGKLGAQEVLSGTQSELLAPYRPDRDFAEVRRY